MLISGELDKNIAYLEKTFKDCGDIVKRKFPVGETRRQWVFVIYADNMTDRAELEVNIINSLMISVRYVEPSVEELAGNVFEGLRDGGISSADITETAEMDDVVFAVLSGNTPLLLDGYKKALIISTRKYPTRGVQATDTEVVIQGSKEAFTEVMRMNTALIRRRIRDPNLKIRQLRVGRRSQTDVALVYMEGIVRPQVLGEALKRIERINIDAILDSGYIEQLIEGNWLSPLPQAQVTERPDKSAAAVLEGRIVIIVDNSPFVLIIPATFNTFFQAVEDYYQRWGIMSMLRCLRYTAGVLSVTLPGLYLSATLYHPSMLPTVLIYKLVESRMPVPFPAAIEVLIMDAAFELLREAGVRLPGPIGNTIGIVGGLIIGQAAVEAGLASPIVVIVIALTGICGFAIPHVSLVTGFRLMKYLILIMAAALGLYGFCLASIIILIHMASLKSFGIPYMFPFVSGEVNNYGDFKDTLFRVPLFMMKRRPIFAKPDNVVRQK
ncbi:MAG: spore germination protein [Clostridiales bacterium]|jgi:spore germination protein|nr:spore germination protein [Clostridiales bacterium]